eukprot:TRINITY_DN20846_c0_g1_i1.p1 TRINITY_DN20846_c0_g1~~TRINITY_DN20846_c0_g1_i1.p1  ORF type:complete len:775 (+),score=342.55 TRINITY_DN20846_c0_g1_i1:335-2326(+)
MTFSASAYPDIVRSRSSSSNSNTDLLRTLSAPTRSTPRTWKLKQAKTRVELSEALATFGVQVREDIRNGSLQNSVALDRTPSTGSKRSGSILDQLKKLEELKEQLATREEEILACVSMGEKLIEQLKQREEEVMFLSDQNEKLRTENIELTNTLQEEARGTLRSNNVDKVTAALAMEELVAAEARLREKEEALQREKDDMQWCKRETLRNAAEATSMALQIGELEATVADMHVERLVMKESVARARVADEYMCHCLQLMKGLEIGVLPIVTDKLKTEAMKNAKEAKETLDILKSENDEMRATIRKMEEAVSSKSSELGAAYQELNGRSLELKEKEGAIKSLEEDIGKVEVEVRGLKETLHKTLKDKEEYVSRQKTTEKKLQSDLEEKTLEVKELTAELNKVKEAYRNTEVEWKGKASNLRMEGDAKDVQIKHLLQKLEIQEEETRILTEEKAGLAARLQDKTATCAQQDALNVEIHQLRVEMANQKNAEAALRKVLNTRQNEIETMVTERNKMANESKAQQAALEVMREELGGTKAALKGKGERCERLKMELETLCVKLKESSVRLADLEGEVNSGLVEMAELQDENKKLKEENTTLEVEVKRLGVLEQTGKRNPVVEQIVDRMQALKALGEIARPIIVKARFISRIAEKKLKAAGGACVVSA